MRITTFILTGFTVLFVLMSCNEDELNIQPVAPSLEITFSKNAPVGDASITFELISRAYLKNISDQSVFVKVRRSVDNPTRLTDNNSICWEYCYVQSIEESPDAIELFPGEINQDFTGHVYPDGDGAVSDGEITYIFFNEEEPRDKVVFTTIYKVQ
ncbi:MAG: hypothetical protein GY751_00415 [Bacteroidetes bacterium]|nr:hypothetical protein [Bacteroidota bacterium]